MSYAKCPYCGNTSDVGICPWCGPTDIFETIYARIDDEGNETQVTEEEYDFLDEEDRVKYTRTRQQYWPWERI
jgi:hypothetical protein